MSSSCLSRSTARKQYPSFLSKPHPPQIVPVPSSEQDVNQRKFRKTRMCRYLPECLKGNNCPFAHSEKDLRAPPDLSKTRMCAGWLRNRCTMSASECRFAHGEAELRAAPPVPPPASISETEATAEDDTAESSTYLDPQPLSSPGKWNPFREFELPMWRYAQAPELEPLDSSQPLQVFFDLPLRGGLHRLGSGVLGLPPGLSGEDGTSAWEAWESNRLAESRLESPEDGFSSYVRGLKSEK